MNGLGKPRHTSEGEKTLLGSLMKDADLIPDVSVLVTTNDFYEAKHQTIWDTLLRMHDDGKPTTPAAVHQDLTHHGLIDQVGGAGYLGELAMLADVPSALYWATLIKEEATGRNLAAFHERGYRDAQSGSGIGAGELIAAAQSGLDEVADERTSNDVVKVESVFMDTLEHIEALANVEEGATTGLPTGFRDLDEKTTGFHPGQVVVVAARPGGGKSTLGLDFCRAAAIAHGEPCAIFSLEMSRIEITTRLISAECRIPLQKLKKGDLDQSEWERIAKKMPTITEAPLFIDDSANTTMREIKTKARRIQQRYGLKLIVIDYLQLMEGDGRADSREQEVAKISRQCKLLAKELGVTVVVMSQLNRGPENRADKKPVVSDLRESGAIEQDADLILLIYREETAIPDSARVGEADLIIGKQRSGPSGIEVTVAAQLHLSRFFDMATDF